MSEEKEIVFIKPEDVPRVFRGSKGRNWAELFNQIPEGEVAVLDTETYGSAPNIRSQVKLYNKDNKAEILTVTQRTNKETEKVTVYVHRVK